MTNIEWCSPYIICCKCFSLNLQIHQMNSNDKYSTYYTCVHSGSHTVIFHRSNGPKYIFNLLLGSSLHKRIQEIWSNSCLVGNFFFLVRWTLFSPNCHTFIQTISHQTWSLKDFPGKRESNTKEFLCIKVAAWIL